MSFSDTDVQGALKNLIDPNTKKDFVSGKSVKNVKVSGSDVSLDIMLGYPAKSVMDEIRAMVEAHLKKSLPGAGKISVNVSSKVVPHAVQRGVKLGWSCRRLQWPASCAPAFRAPRWPS